MNRFIVQMSKTAMNVPRFTFTERFKEKEKGEEKAFFTKEDQKAMKKLLSKMESQSKSSSGEDSDKKELQNIFSRYRVTYSDGLIEEILRWKRD